jgi:hypothetical protein
MAAATLEVTSPPSRASATISLAVVDHHVEEGIAGQEVQRHLIQVVELVGRHREGLIDGLVRFAARGRVEAPDRCLGGRARCGRAGDHTGEQTRTVLGRLGRRHRDVVGSGQVHREQTPIVVVPRQIPLGSLCAPHE